MATENDKNKVEDATEEVAELAESIVRVADAAEELLKGGLTRKALVVLLQDIIGTSNITRSQISEVLDALPRLRKYVQD